MVDRLSNVQVLMRHLNKINCSKRDMEELVELVLNKKPKQLKIVQMTKGIFMLKDNLAKFFDVEEKSDQVIYDMYDFIEGK